jgi:hypothetical protein
MIFQTLLLLTVSLMCDITELLTKTATSFGVVFQKNLFLKRCVKASICEFRLKVRIDQYIFYFTAGNGTF